MKTILKVIYLAVAMVATVLIVIGLYSSELSNNYASILNEAVKTGDETGSYSEVGRALNTFEVPLDAHSVTDACTTGESGKKENISAIFPSINMYQASYTKEGEKSDTEVKRIENLYLFAILHPTFQKINLADGTNCSGIRFYGEEKNGETPSWLFKFNVSSTVNAAEYIDKPSTEEQVTFSCERNLTTSYEVCDMIFFPLFECQVNYISDKVGGKITGYNLVNNVNATVYSETVPVTFDFSEPFFDDMTTYVKSCQVELAKKNGEDVSDSDLETAQNYLKAFNDDRNTVPGFTEKYASGIFKNQVYTGAPIIMKTIGMAALFVVVVGIFFFVLFYFHVIRRFVAKYIKKEEVEDTRPRMPKQQKRKVVISKPKAEPAEAVVIDAEPVEAEAENKDAEPVAEESSTEAEE